MNDNKPRTVDPGSEKEEARSEKEGTVGGLFVIRPPYADTPSNELTDAAFTIFSFIVRMLFKACRNMSLLTLLPAVEMLHLWVVTELSLINQDEEEQAQLMARMEQFASSADAMIDDPITGLTTLVAGHKPVVQDNGKVH